MEEGKYYHVYNRGNNKENLFKEEMNYSYFINKYIEHVSPHVDTFAYCLMPNHFHFVVRVKEFDKTSEVFKTSEVLTDLKIRSLSSVEKGFKNFFIAYAKAINKKYNRTGSLFQSKFKKKEIKNELYLTRLVLYVHNNPVEAGLCEKPSDWLHSSYNSILKNEPTFIQDDEVIRLFNDPANFKYCHTMNSDFDEDYFL